MINHVGLGVRYSMLEHVHPTWHDMLLQALMYVSDDYLRELEMTQDWLPGSFFLFSAFRLPASSVRFILLGESPYPRAQSANGHAFWDAAVHDLWSATGFSKQVNRATSLRNMMKMLLHARGDLVEDFSQPALSLIHI